MYTDQIELLPASDKKTEKLIKENVSSEEANIELYPSLKDAFKQDSEREFKKIESNFKFITFLDMFSLSKTINLTQNPVTYSNLPAPYEFFDVGKTTYKLDQMWYDQATRPSSLMKCFIKIHRYRLFQDFIHYALYASSNLFSSLVLGKIMGIMTAGSNRDMDEVLYSLIVYTIGFVLLCIAVLIFGNLWAHTSYTIGWDSKLSIMGFIYKKINRVSLSSLNEISLGKVINILANDLNDIDSNMLLISPLLATPFTLLLSLYILWNQFGKYSLLTLGLQVLILACAICLSNISESPRNEKNLVNDQRIKYTNEFIENIRLIKLYVWEKPLREMILKLRDRETIALKKLARIDSISTMLTDCCTYISIVITCIAYVFFEDGVLTPEKVYTTGLVLNFAKNWVIFCAHRGFIFLVNLRMMDERLQEILKVEDIVGSQRNSEIIQKIPNSDQFQDKSKNLAVVFKNFRAVWNSNSMNPCLRDINIAIKKGELLALIGKVGSGKTTFMLSFLREIPVTSGELAINGSIAYVEQEPVIFTGSVRDNITFGQEYEESFYSRVLRACNLDEDLKQLDHGDQTIIGERGTTLSGGQKARISLARALYARRDIYLLDDPLSAVDSRVGKVIFERVIKDILKDKTVILVTHHLNFAKEADRVIVMKDGGIEAEGKFDELSKMNIDLLQLFSQNEANAQKNAIQTNDLKRFNSSKTLSSLNDVDLILNEAKQDISQEESILTHKTTYIRYLKDSKNYGLAFFTLGCYLISQASIFWFAQVLGRWGQVQSEAESIKVIMLVNVEVDNSYYATFASLLVISIIICSYGKTFLTNKFLLETNSKLHQQMLNKISRAFVSFFDSTPIGVVLNRFSNDLGVLDKANPPTVFDVIDQSSLILVFAAYLCYVSPFLIIIAILISYGLFQIKNFFAKPTMELRRLDLMSRSPIYSQISSTLHGLLAIRVYQQGYRFVKQFADLLYVCSKVNLAFLRTNRLFCLMLDSLLYFFIISYILIFIFLHYFNKIEMGMLGLALYYLMIITDYSTWAIRQTIALDVNMQSAQRIQQYCDLQEEPILENDDNDTSLKTSQNESWPLNGQISFRNVHLKYSQTDNYALNGLTFSIEPNTKVGIVGRTGAGKSSIIQALFRIVEIEDLEDSYIKIDGINIKTIGLETLRRSLSILPQTPVIFSGTIRRNLDPFDKFPEYKLWEVLDQVNLANYVESLEKKLDTDMSTSSSVFSAGQKQLVCLARAILRKNKVVILDEATANVDITTDSLIQEKINEIFKGCVILTIAHRLITIANYDKILVLDKGRLVEYDHPYKLLVEKIGDTTITKVEGTFVKMVKNCGEKTSKEIFEKAYSGFMSKNSKN